MAEKVKDYEPFFGEWRIGRVLGEGTYGKVFEIYREETPGRQTRSCVKYVHLPKDKDIQEQLKKHPGDYDSVRKWFKSEVENKINNEISVLLLLKENINIVHYEEHMVFDNVGEHQIGWDLLLRMELLKPVEEKFSEKNVTQYDVVQMWMQLLNALMYCEQKKVIHRDIKPGNIMLSPDGRYYKLCDFGESVILENKKQIRGRAGNQAYMAPEVHKGEWYDQRADIYSLGLVIYFYMNRQRRWFCSEKAVIGKKDAAMEQATKRRLDGEIIPPIKEISPELNMVLAKMIAYDPKMRYQRAADVYMDLLAIVRVQEKLLKRTPLYDREIRHSGKWVVPAGIAGAVLIVGITAFLVIKSPNTQQSPQTPIETETDINREVEKTERKKESEEIAERETEIRDPIDIGESARITLSVISATYNEKVQKPEISSLKVEGKTLTEGTDFVVEYDENTDWINAGKHTVRCKGINGFTGNAEAEFEIKRSNIENALISYEKSVISDGKEHHPSVKVQLGENLLEEGKDFLLEYGEGDWTATGSYTFSVKGIGNYRETVTKVFRIEDIDAGSEGTEAERSDSIDEKDDKESGRIDLAEANISLTPSSVVFEGSEQKPEITIQYGGKELVEGKDYKLNYDAHGNDWISAGTHVAECIGIGDYKGEISVDFLITSTSMKNAAINYNDTTGFNGEVQRPALNVVLDDVILEEGKDITVEYGPGDWESVGEYKFTIKGIGNYKDTCERTFSITKKDIEKALNPAITLSQDTKTYDGKLFKPSVTLAVDGKELKEGKDFTVDYDTENSDWVSVGTHSLRITGKGNYTGTLLKEFRITQMSLEDCEIEAEETGVYSGKEQFPAIQIEKGKKELVEGVDYEITEASKGWTEAGEYSYVVHGIGNYSGEYRGSYVIEPVTIAADNVLFENSGYYTGESLKPEDVQVEVQGRKLEKDTDYRITYREEQWVDEGTYHFTVTGIGNYSGSAEKEFSIQLSPEEIERRQRLKDTKVIGMLESPEDDSSLKGGVRCKGWLLASSGLQDFDAYVDIVSKNGVEKTLELNVTESKEKTYKKLREEHEEDIIAERGYSVKCNDELEGLEDGAYKLRLKIIVKESGEEFLLQEKNVQIGSSERMDADEMKAFLGMDTSSQTRTSYVNEDMNFAIGIDLEQEVFEDTGNGVTLLGWFSAPKGSSVGPVLEIEENGQRTLYTAETIREAGGLLSIERAPRVVKEEEAKLSDVNAELDEDNGMIIQIKLPFLSAGEHEVILTFNVGVSDGSEQVKMKPFTIKMDANGINSSYVASETIVTQWEKELPKKEEQTEKEEQEEE